MQSSVPKCRTRAAMTSFLGTGSVLENAGNACKSMNPRMQLTVHFSSLIFASSSPTLNPCSKAHPANATSWSAASGAARTSPRWSRHCLRHGSRSRVRCAASTGAICRLKCLRAQSVLGVNQEACAEHTGRDKVSHVRSQRTHAAPESHADVSGRVHVRGV